MRRRRLLERVRAQEQPRNPDELPAVDKFLFFIYLV